MKKYLFDTNICIYYIRGFYDLNTKFNAVKEEDRYISEITLAELKFGVKNSEFPRKNKKVLDNFLTGLQVLPIYFSLGFAEKLTIYF
ncbi:PIN domain-containing protein [Tangfeifania diversioriginum]|uniref:PIN domain-containing protein n=1 Tax=Tangfeifania diversioriginum TaxID=1168035 RepID=A0A1M6MF79_9BACT|nr:PIN domain-containing protein [Tangfeifania diversioriginum]SHJ82134.1 PIN domain-containing protein [Tangfeifania diversioriginum]